jgi:ubiquinone/menaquinone biosynthesis C-methylase UbiE
MPPESYLQTDNPAFEAQLAARTADREAAFMLPHLKPGMDLLDVGCGPATITLGLAQAVAPGQVVAVDRDAGQIDRSRAYAAGQNVRNIRFEVADAYALPFPDASFDAAFSHAVFMHLSDPVRALREIRRVLRAGGIVGLRDPDVTGMIQTPRSPVLDEYRQLRAQAQQYTSANPTVGRHYRALLLEAGFGGTTAGAEVISAGDAEGCRSTAAFLQSQLNGFAGVALAHGLADEAKVEKIRTAIDEWAARPDAFYACAFCHAVAWNDRDPHG